MTKEVDREAPRAERDAGERPMLRLSVQELMRGRKEAILEHNGQDYRLRVTASGKLILTK